MSRDDCIKNLSTQNKTLLGGANPRALKGPIEKIADLTSSSKTGAKIRLLSSTERGRGPQVTIFPK